MMTHRLTAFAVIASAAASFAASNDGDIAKRLQIYPKNFARQHVGANLFVYNEASKSYSNTEAAAAWLDDDVVTGWPPMSGKQHYLLSLEEPQLLTNFCFSGRSSKGTVSIYAGDEIAAPGAKSWTPLAADIPIASINEVKMSKPFSRFAKYILIETNLESPGTWYSVYLYGEQPAVTYSLARRASSLDTASVFGAFVNLPTSFNLAGLYAHGAVTHASADAGFVGWQKAVDDNPQSGVAIAPTSTESGLAIRLANPRALSRISILTDASAKGRLDFFVVTDAQASAAATGSQYIKAATDSTAPAAPGQAISLADLTPSASMVLDGTNARANIEFPAETGEVLLARWTPETDGQALNVREVNAFGEPTLASYELSRSQESIAELNAAPSRSDDAGESDYAGDSSDYKDYADYKGGKEALPPEVAEGPGDLPLRAPFLPGALGFPPILTNVGTPNPPNENPPNSTPPPQVPPPDNPPPQVLSP